MKNVPGGNVKFYIVRFTDPYGHAHREWFRLKRDATTRTNELNAIGAGGVTCTKETWTVDKLASALNELECVLLELKETTYSN